MHNEYTVSEQHRSFLNKRGITDKVIAAFSIHTADVPELRLHSAITIPVRHVDGTHSFNKYRRDPMEGDVKPKYLFERGGKVTLYGADRLVAELSTHNASVYKDVAELGVSITRKLPVIITEGELDTLVCWSAGIPAVSSTAGAVSFQPEWVELLSRYEVYVCFDNDEAGHKGVIKVLDYLPEAKVIFVPKNIPDVKDISDYVARGGDLHALMATAKQYLTVADVELEAERIAAQWGDYSFHTLFIEHRKPLSLPTNVSGAAKPTSQSDDRKERAKSVSCLSLLPFNTRGRYPITQCLWHNDHDPSLTYYERNNSCYCHVCGKYADSIDIMMAVNGLSGPDGFKEALKLLLKES